MELDAPPSCNNHNDETSRRSGVVVIVPTQQIGDHSTWLDFLLVREHAQLHLNYVVLWSSGNGGKHTGSARKLCQG